MTPYHREFELNTEGRDYVTGDLHGTLDELHEFLKEVHFDHSKDRLFCTGDLVDRGPDSMGVVALLDEPWFFTVRGNHEDMAINAYESTDNRAIYMHILNGGDWFYKLDDETKASVIEKFKALPYAMTLNRSNGVRVGIIHADVFGDWDDIIKKCAEHDESPRWIWGRDRWNNKDRTPVTGIYRVYTGHTVVPHPGMYGNVVFVDTGGWLPDNRGYQSFIELDD